MELKGQVADTEATLSLDEARGTAVLSGPGIATRWIHLDREPASRILLDPTGDALVCGSVTLESPEGGRELSERFLTEARRHTAEPVAIGLRLPGVDTRPADGQPAPPRRSPTRKRAHEVAGVVEAASWVFIAIGVLGGLGVAVQTTHDDFTGTETRPFIAQGLGLAIASSFWGLTIVMIAAYIRSRTE